MKNLLVLLIISYAFLPGIFAQSKVEKRIEIDEWSKFYTVHVVNAKQNGVVVLSKQQGVSGSNFIWKTNLYSSELNLVSSTELSIPKNFLFESSFANDTHSFLYFKTLKGQYQLIRIDNKTGNRAVVTGIAPKRFKSIQFRTLENIVYLFYNSSADNTCKIVDFETKTDKDFKVNAGNYKGFSLTVNQMVISKENDELVFIMEGYNDRSRDLILASYALNGDYLRIMDIGKLSSSYLQGHNVSIMGDGNYLITGTYALDESSKLLGIYSTLMNEDSVNFYTETPFVTLQSFDKSTRDESETARELRKILEHIEVSSHPIIVNEMGYFISSEFYRSVYTTSAAAGMFFGLAGAMISYKFSGYHYDGATIIGFDWNGNLLWDVPLDLKLNNRPMTKKLHMQVAQQTDDFLLTFPHINKTKTVNISSNGEVKTNHAELYDIPEKTEHWHNNYYLNYGEFYLYTTHNETSVEDKITTKRKAFFIEKIATK